MEFYGARLSESYGKECPPSWADAVNDATNDDVKRALSLVRVKHVSHPPTLPEFEGCLRRATPVQSNEPTPQELLVTYVMGIYEKRLTQKQIRGQWLFTYRRVQWVDYKKDKRDDLAECTGVVIPADGESLGYRVTIEDMRAGIETPNFGSAA